MEKLYIVKAENAGKLTVNLTFSDNTTQLVDVGDFALVLNSERRNKRKLLAVFHPQYLDVLSVLARDDIFVCFDFFFRKKPSCHNSPSKNQFEI